LLYGEEESCYSLFAGVLFNSPNIANMVVNVDSRVGHSIYEVTFHPRNARAALFAVLGGDALRCTFKKFQNIKE
jgi:hypothetical protein